ncbi:MAG TPA: type IV secretory system conjugative DNA transfer family protein [Ktedonobacteraceae bacterium]|nr:type IV secretory system conjugative DNA transfer family protein [Ktedonobacteraceae bacterium]
MGPFLLAIKRFFLLLGEALSHLRVLFSSDDTRLHRARFATPRELNQICHPTPSSDGLLLGTMPHDYYIVRPTKSRRELGNILIVAPTRGGKGLLATSQLLSWQHSVIVNDIKGELYTQTAGYRSSIGPVYVIDPTGVGNCFDPLSGKYTEDALYSAATQLLFTPDEGDGAIFTQRASVMLTQMFLAARLEGSAPFPYVRFLIRLGLADTAARLNTIDPDLATQFLDINFSQSNMTDRFLLSAWGTLTTRMRPLLTETVVRSLTQADVTPEELLCAEKPVSVYLRWKEQDLLALSPLVRLLWGTLINELITAYDQKQGTGCSPVLMLIDEAGRTAIPSLADQATTVVGRGISLWIAIQSLSQLETVYGRARAQVLKDNMETQIYYRPTDLATAQYLEQRLGRTSAFARSETMRDGEQTSEGHTEQAIPLLSSQDIAQLTDTEIIGFHRNLPPLRMSRMDWRNHPLLTQRQHLPAPPLANLPQLSEQAYRSTDIPSHDLIDPDMIRENGEQEKDHLN